MKTTHQDIEVTIIQLPRQKQGSVFVRIAKKTAEVIRGILLFPFLVLFFLTIVPFLRWAKGGNEKKSPGYTLGRMWGEKE